MCPGRSIGFREGDVQGTGSLPMELTAALCSMLWEGPELESRLLCEGAGGSSCLRGPLKRRVRFPVADVSAGLGVVLCAPTRGAHGQGRSAVAPVVAVS